MAKENIDVTVELHDQLSRPAGRAERAINSLEHEVEQLDEQMLAADATAASFTRALAAVRRAAGNTSEDLDKTSASTKKFDTNARAAGGKGGGSDALKKGMKDAGDAGEFLQKVMKMFKWSAFATAAHLAAGGVSALGAAGYAAIAGLSPLVGVLGAVPALLGGVLSMVAAVKLGFSGIGPAVKALTDPAQDASAIAQAMDKLSPPAQQLALDMAALKKRTDGWRTSIQAAMLPAFSKALHNVEAVFPVIRKGLTDTGGAVGRLAVSLSKELGGAGKDLQTIFARNTRLIDHGLNPALTAATSIGLDFMVAGGPLAERFATWLGQAATNVAKLVEHGRKTGALTDFLSRAGDLASSVFHVLGDVAVALFNIGKNSDALSASMGHGFADMVHRWREWTASVSGQNAIQKWFEDARPVVQALANTVKILGKGLMSLAGDNNLAQLINQINDQLLPAVLNLANGAANQLGPGIVAAVSAFVKFESLLSYSPMADLLNGIAAAANGVLDVVNALPGPVKFLIASLVAMKFAASGLSKVMPDLTSGMGKLKWGFGEVKAGAQLYSEGMTGMARVTGVVKGSMVGLKSAAGGVIGALGGPWGIAITGAVAALGFFLSKQAEAKQRIEDVQASLDQQTAAITDNTRATIAKALEDDGTLQAAQKLGISLDTVTDATLGSKDAMEQIRVVHDAWVHDIKNGKNDVDAYNAAYANWGTWQTFLKGMGESTYAVDAATDSQKRIAEAMGYSSYQFAQQAGSADANGRSLSRAAENALGLGRNERGAQPSIAGTTDHLNKQADATQKVIDKTLVLQDTLLKNQRSYVGFKGTILASTKTLNQNAHTLDLNTQAGVDNKNALLDVAEAAGSVTNQAQRQKALKEARQYIYQWGLEAFGSKKKADALADSMIKVQTNANDLNGMHANVTVTASGLDKIITDADRASQAISDLVASQGQVRVTHNGTPARRHGGPVWEQQRFRIGEVGPELFVGVNGAVEVIGRAGEESRTFSQPGYVLPNEYYEAARPVAVAAPAAEPAMAGAASSSADTSAPLPVPPIHMHLHGDSGALTPADVEAAAMRAYRRWEQERKERR